jgi:hypothetical protein
MVTAAQAAGRYVGFDPLYVVDLTAGGGGTLHKLQRTAKLTNVAFDGTELHASAVFAGTSEPFHATFVIEVKNGQRLFGILSHKIALPVGENMTAQELFCPRQ